MKIVIGFGPSLGLELKVRERSSLRSVSLNGWGSEIKC